MRRRKRIGIWEILAHRKCPRSLREALRRGGRQPTDKFGAIGQITHKLAEEGDDAVNGEFVQQILATIDEGEREEVVARSQELAAKNEEMIDDDDVTERDQEKQLRWTDPVTGWTICAKPDEIGWLDDKMAGRVMQITDIKTGYKVKRWHKAGVYLFGLIASLALDYHKSIKLVVRMLGSGEEAEFWYSPKLTQTCLEELRETLREIEQDWEMERLHRGLAKLRAGSEDASPLTADQRGELLTDLQGKLALIDKAHADPMTVPLTELPQAFPSTPGWYCRKCKHQEGCPGWAAFQDEHPGLKVVEPAPLVVQLPQVDDQPAAKQNLV